MATSVPARLAPYVRSLQTYDVTYAVPSGVHIGMPAPAVSLVLPLDDPLEVSWSARPESRTQTWASVSGLHLQPAQVHHGRRQRGIQLALTPAGTRALLGVPAAALAGQLLELGEVAPAASNLPERLAESSTWSARLAVLGEAFEQALARHRSTCPRAEVGRALALLTRGARVADVAAEVGYSRRRLTALVGDEVGISPKQFQRLARFDASHQRVREAAMAGEVRISVVAADAGYADQAHLTREWSELAGCSPTAWLAREFPIVQANAGLRREV